jgi:4-amino-4-deoxy-L-arabinose transferase-like glycosyltransferase
VDTYQKRFWLFLSLLTVLRLAFIGRFDLSPDEAYYWTWSRHLDWAYYDQGPLIALVIRFFTSLVGRSTEWSVRLGAVALSVLSSVTFFDLLRRMFADTRTAWLGFLAMQSALLFTAGSLLMMHDSIMVFFWIAALWAFYRAFFEDWLPGMYLGALALGLGALAKYSMALFVPCLVLFILISPAHRVWWRTPHLYLGGCLTLLLVSPLVLWNAAHGSASFGHIATLGGVHQGPGFSFKTAGEFISGQLGVMTPWLGAWAWWAPVVAWGVWKNKLSGGTRYLFLACFSAPVLLFFLLLSFHSPVYANWPAPAYVAALGILAPWVLSAGEKSRRLTWFRGAWITGAVLTTLVLLEVGFGVFPLPQAAARSVDRVRGWRALGEETARRLAALNGGAPAPFLAARRYQIAAELSFYIPGQPEVQLFPKDEPAHNQYRFWDRRTRLEGQNALFVCEDGWEVDYVRTWFVQLTELPVYRPLYHGRGLRDIHFCLAQKLLPEPRTTGYAEVKE